MSFIFSLLCILFKFQILVIFKPYKRKHYMQMSAMNGGIHCKSGTSFMGLAVNAGLNEERQNIPHSKVIPIKLHTHLLMHYQH